MDVCKVCGCYESNHLTCDECGSTLHVGQYPTGCKGDRTYHTFGNSPFEEPMEPVVDENLTTDPNGVLVTTRAQRRKLMSEHHLEYAKNRFADRQKHRTYFFQGR